MPLLGQVELDLLCRRGGLPTRTEHRRIALGHLGRFLHVQVSLGGQPLDDLVEQLGELLLQLAVARRIAGGFAAQQASACPG
jgi:hypothetical protein